jgi:hypothetical protein
MTISRILVSIAITAGSISFLSSLNAQTPAEVRSAFKNLRSDHIKHNCGHAMAWLYAHREALKNQMLQELYVTDPQGRDALLLVLLNTESFVPDDRFRRLVIGRLTKEDTEVGNGDIEDFTEGLPIAQYRGKGLSAHWTAWNYIDHHFSEFEPLLQELISRGASMFAVWGSTWLLAKHHELNKNFSLFSQTVLERIAKNLKNDDIPYNAGQAVRVFLLLGKTGIPTLQNCARSSDNQMASLSRALIDAILHGKHEAFGYMNAEIDINEAPTSDELKEPPWLDDITGTYVEKFSANENLPYP